MATSTAVLVIASVALAVACGSREDSGAPPPTDDGGAGRGAGGAGDPFVDGASSDTLCSMPPALGFDPLVAYTPPQLTPTVVVTTTADDGAGSLRAAVSRASDGAVIGFSPALAGKTIALETTIEIPTSLTIDGSAAPGITIDAQKKVGALHFNGDGPTRLGFFALSMVGGSTTGSGGAISLNGGSIDLEIGGCRFDGNTAAEGGAIRVGYAKKTNAFIHDSVFSNNDGSIANNGFSGGAVSATGTNLSIARCRFENNKGTVSGAVYTIHSDPVITDSVFVGNSSAGKGGTGAFFTDGGGPGDDNNPGTVPGKNVIQRSRFDANRGAGTDGGAIMLWGYPMDALTIEDSVFHGNVCEGGAKGGGAKIHARNTLRIARTVFVGNTSSDQGGGIWLDGEGPFELENVLFSGNTATSDRGGGATFNVSGKVTMSHVTFADNGAGQGCGAFWLNSADADVHLRSSIVANNTGTNTWEIQVGYPPIDDGGNLEWPGPGSGKRVAPGGLVDDPLLGALTEQDGTFVRMPGAGSPAIDAAPTPGPAEDARGAPRDAKPDIGAFEVGPSCR